MSEEIYDCDAPSFCDFAAGQSDGEGDAWFDTHTEKSFEGGSPASCGDKRSALEHEQEEEENMASNEEEQPAQKRLKKNDATAQPTKAWEPKLTKAKSPQFSTNNRTRASKFKNSEEAELEEIKKAQEMRSALFKQRIMSMRKAIAGSPIRGKVEPKKLTSPKPFHFRSEGVKPFYARKQEELLQEQLEPSTARPVTRQQHQKKKKQQQQEQGAEAQVAKPKLTTPREFHFLSEERVQRYHQRSEGQVATSEEKQEEWVPLAKKTTDFLTKTPVRFRVRKQGEVFRNVTEAEHRPIIITKPQAPTFLTDSRIKGSKFKSHDEEEEEKYKNEPKFKARPLNKRILESVGDLGVPRVPKKELTEPELFNLATDARSESIRARELRDLQQEEHKPFKARPWSAHASTSLAQHSLAPANPTIPESPMLSTKQRGTVYALRHQQEQQEGDKFQFKARPMPVSEPFQVQHTAKKTNAPFKVFQLATEERGKLHEEQSKSRLQEEEQKEREARHFKARPLVEGHDAPVPRIEIPLTNPEPFALESERLHQQAMQKWQSQVQQEEQENMSKRNFKARAYNKDQPTFIPQPSNKPLTEVSMVELNSDKRADKRRDFDEKLSKKEADMARLKEIQEMEMKLREQEEVAELRKSMTFKATKIMKGKQEFVPQPSDKPLTVPKTPVFATKTRSLAKDVY